MWQNIQGVRSAQRMTVELSMDPTNLPTYGNLDNYIKYEMALKLAQQLVDSEFVQIVKLAPSVNNPYADNIFQATLNVLPFGCDRGIIDYEKYTVDGMEYSHEDITKAVRNTFPENFL